MIATLLAGTFAARGRAARAGLAIVVLVGAACAGQPDRAAFATQAPAPTPAVSDIDSGAVQSTPAATVATRTTGRLEERSFYSPILGRSMTYHVYVPPGYDALPQRSFGSVYMLHGVAGDSTEWVSIGVPGAMDQLIASGDIHPFLVVFPNGGTSYYIDHPAYNVHWARYVINDVVGSVDATYRTIAEPRARAVSGLSMGGEGALQLGFRFPHVFGVIAAHSPSSRLLFEHVPADIYDNDAYFRTVSPYWIAQSTLLLGSSIIWIDIGDEDHWEWNARALHATLRARGIRHQYNVLPGKHEGEYWVEHLPKYLSYYAANLPRAR